MYHILQFVKSVGNKQIIHLNAKDFQNYLDNYKFTSVSQQNQVINSIRFLYKYGLNKKYDKVSFKRPRSEKKLPRIIQKHLGYSNSKTTEIYTHVSTNILQSMALPI